MKKIVCNVCGFEFYPSASDHYISRDTCKTGVITALSNDEVKIFDTFDCMQCGCQVVVQERKRLNVEENESCNKVDAKEHDCSCVGCKYEDRDGSEYPCCYCSNALVNLYVSANEDESEDD